MTSSPRRCERKDGDEAMEKVTSDLDPIESRTEQQTPSRSLTTSARVQLDGRIQSSEAQKQEYRAKIEQLTQALRSAASVQTPLR